MTRLEEVFGNTRAGDALVYSLFYTTDIILGNFIVNRRSFLYNEDILYKKVFV
jgi:hypothetical protein